MKKLTSAIVLIVAMLALNACNMLFNSPKATVDKAYKCLVDKNYDEFNNYFYFNEDETASGVMIDLAKVGVKNIAKGLYSAKDLKSYKITEESITDDNTAVVKVEETYNNGKTYTETVHLRKTKQGNWKWAIK